MSNDSEYEENAFQRKLSMRASQRLSARKRRPGSALEKPNQVRQHMVSQGMYSDTVFAILYRTFSHDFGFLQRKCEFNTLFVNPTERRWIKREG